MKGAVSRPCPGGGGHIMLMRSDVLVLSCLEMGKRVHSGVGGGAQKCDSMEQAQKTARS